MAGELMAPTVGLTVMDATTRSTSGTPITTEVRQEQVIANLRQQADDVRERERQRSRTMSNLGGGGFKAQEGPEAELRELRKSFKTMPTKEVPRDLAGKQPMQMSNPVEGAAQKINKWFYTAAVKEQQEQRAIQHQAYIASIEAMSKQAEKERQAQQQLLGMNDPLNEGSPSEAFAPLTMPEPENAKESIDWWNKNIATPNDPMRPTVSTWQEYQAVMGMAKAEQHRANVRLHPEAYIPTDYVSQMMDSGVSFNTIAQNAAFNWDTGRIDVKDHAGVALGSFSPEGGTMHGLVNRGGDYLIGLTTQMANVDRLTQSGLWDQATIDSVKGSLNMLDTLQQRMQAGKTETGTSFALPTNLQSDYDVWRKMRGAEVAGAETYQQNAARLISSPVLSDPDSGRHSATNQGKEIVSTVQVDGVGLTAAIDAAQNLKTLVNLPGGNSTAVNGLIGQGERMLTGISHSIGAGIGGGAMLDGLAVPVSPSPTATDTDNLRHASALVNQGGIPTVTPATPAIAAAVATPSSDTLLSLYANRPSTLYNPDGLRFQQKTWGDSRIDAWKKYTPGETAEGVEAMLAFYNQRNDAGNRINYMAPELRSNLLTEIAKSYSRGGASFNPVRQFADVYEKTENIQGLPFMDTYFGRAGSSHMSPDQRVNALASVVKTATDAGYRLSESQQEQYQKMVQSYDDQGFFSSSRTIDRQVPTAGQMLQYVRENAAIEGPSVDLGLARRQSAVGAPGSLIELYATQPKVFNPKGLTDQQKMLGDSRVDTSLKYTPVETREGIDTLVAIARAQGGMPAGVRESMLGDIARSYDRIPGVQGEDQFAAIHAELAGRIAVPAPVGRPAVTPVPSVPATQTPSVLLPKQSVGAGIGAGAGIPGLMYLTATINTAKPSHPNYVVPTGIDQTAVASINEMLAGRQPLPAPPGAVVTPDVPEFTLFTSQAKTATIGGKGSLNTITETPLQIRAGEENWAQVSATLNQYVQHNDPIPAQVQTDLKKIVEENVQWETASDKRRAIQYIDDYTKMAEQTDRIDTLLTTMQTENRELTDGEIRDAYRIVSEIGKYDTEVARQYKGIVHDAEVKKYVDAGIGTLQEYGDSMDQAEIDRRIGGLNTAINQFGDDGLKTYYQAIPAGIMKAAPFIKDINRMFGVDPSHDWGALAKEGVLTDEGLQEAIAARDKAIDTQLAGMPDAFRTELKQNSRNAFEYYDIMSEANRLTTDARASRITDAEFQTRSQALSDRMAKFDQTSGMTLFSAKSAYTNITTGKTEETGPTYGEQVMQDIAARKGEQFNEQMFRQGVADLPVVGGAVAAGMFGLETMGQIGEEATHQFNNSTSFNIGGARIEPVRYLTDKTGISGIFGAMQAPAVFSREAYIGLMHPSHQGITVEMPEFKKFALGLDESIGNEKRQWVTGEAAHAWSAGVREGIIGDQNDPLHTVRSGAAGVAGVGTGLATTPSMFATVGMVQAMESPATMAKIVAGGIGRFAGSTGRYLGTDPSGATAEIAGGIVAGAVGPKVIGTIASPRGFSIGTRTFNPAGRVLNSRPGQWLDWQYQRTRVLPEDRSALDAVLQGRRDAANLDLPNRGTSYNPNDLGIPKQFGEMIGEVARKTDNTALGDAFSLMQLEQGVGKHTLMPKSVYTTDTMKLVANLEQEAHIRGVRVAEKSITDEVATEIRPADTTLPPVRDDAPTMTVLDYGVKPGTEFRVRYEENPLVQNPTDIYIRKAGVDDRGNLDIGYNVFTKYQPEPIRVGDSLYNAMSRVVSKRKAYNRSVGNRVGESRPIQYIKQKVDTSARNLLGVSSERTPSKPFIEPFVEMDGIKVQNVVDYGARTGPETAILLMRAKKAAKTQTEGLFGEKVAFGRAANKVRESIANYYERDMSAFDQFLQTTSQTQSGDTVVLPFRQYMSVRRVGGSRTQPVTELPTRLSELQQHAQLYRDTIQDPMSYRKTPQYVNLRRYTDESVYTTLKTRLRVADDIISQAAHGRAETFGKIGALSNAEAELTGLLDQFQQAPKERIAQLEGENKNLMKDKESVYKEQMKLETTGDSIGAKAIEWQIDDINSLIRSNEREIRGLETGTVGSGYQQHVPLVRRDLERLGEIKKQVVADQQTEMQRAMPGRDRAIKVAEPIRELFGQYERERGQIKALGDENIEFRDRIKTIDNVLQRNDIPSFTQRLRGRPYPEIGVEVRNVAGDVMQSPSRGNLVATRQIMKSLTEANKREIGVLDSDLRLSNRVREQQVRDAAQPVQNEPYPGYYRESVVPSEISDTIDTLTGRNPHPREFNPRDDLTIIEPERNANQGSHQSGYQIDEHGGSTHEPRLGDNDYLDKPTSDLIREIEDVTPEDQVKELGRPKYDEWFGKQAALVGHGSISETLPGSGITRGAVSGYAGSVLSGRASGTMLPGYMPIETMKTIAGMSNVPREQFLRFDQFSKLGQIESDGGDIAAISMFDPITTPIARREMTVGSGGTQPARIEYSGGAVSRRPIGDYWRQSTAESTQVGTPQFINRYILSIKQDSFAGRPSLTRIPYAQDVNRILPGLFNHAGLDDKSNVVEQTRNKHIVDPRQLTMSDGLWRVVGVPFERPSTHAKVSATTTVEVMPDVEAKALEYASPIPAAATATRTQPYRQSYPMTRPPGYRPPVRRILPFSLPRLDLSGGGGKSDKKKIETGKRKIVHPIATPDQMIGKGVFSIKFNHLTVDKDMTNAWGMGAAGKHTVNTTRRVKRTQVAANIGDALTTVTSMKRSKKIRGLVF